MNETTDIKALREECVSWVKDTFGNAFDTRLAKNGDGNDWMSFDMCVAWKVWKHLSSKLEAVQAELNFRNQVLINAAEKRDEALKQLEAERQQREAAQEKPVVKLPDSVKAQDYHIGGDYLEREEVETLLKAAGITIESE